MFVVDTSPPPLRKERLDAVTEGEVPIDSDDVGDAVIDKLLVAVLEKEAVRDELDVTVLEADVVADGVREEEEVIVIVTLSV